jgi:hypothetical protein
MASQSTVDKRTVVRLLNFVAGASVPGEVGATRDGKTTFPDRQVERASIRAPTDHLQPCKLPSGHIYKGR